MRLFTGSILSLAFALSACGQPYRGAIHSGAAVSMRDGVKLVADIYQPETEGKFPVLLERTPYNRAGGAGSASAMAAHGYIVIIQDTRGRFDSQGEFYPFRYESQDGYDTVEWAAKLPYADGKVGMFGGSYAGATQMLAAMASPPHLVAIQPYVTASEYYDGWTYQSGALMQWFASSWSSGLAVDTLRRRAAGLEDPKSWVTQLPVDSYRMLELPPVSALATYFRDWVAHERDDDYWRPWKISDHYGEMNIKALHSGGWHDIFLKGTIQNYAGMRRSSPARADQRLLLGPWAHADTSPEGKIGDVTFGKSAVLDSDATILRWYDYALKGVRNEYATGAPATKAPGSEEPEQYEYDPANPVPTIGGRLCCGNNQLPPGPADQRPNEGRADVLVFSTPPLAKDVEATGWVKATLYASSSAVDTDFTALLADVEPSGYARFLTDGIVRARYRNSTERAEPIEPGKIYEYSINLWATINLFKAGHRIRLYVSSSNFPRFNRNLNTGEPIAGPTRSVKASQRIYHDAQHPSALVLPVIPR